MKKIFTFASIALIALTALSCRKATQDVPAKYQTTPKLEFEGPGALEFKSEGGEICLEFKTTSPLEVKASSEWVGTEVRGRFVYISAPLNSSIYTRYSTVTITSGEQSCSLQAKQPGTPSDYFWEPEYEFDYNGGSLKLKFHKVDVTVRLDIDGQDWISVTAGDEEIVIGVAKNPNAEAREGSVTWKAGDDVRKVVIKQAGNPSGGSGDNPGGGDEPAEISYSSWIGNWNSTAGTLVIAEGDESEGIYVLSFEQFGEQNVPAFYNAETGELEFYSYLLGTNGAWEYYFGAFDSDDYIEMGGPDEDIMLASAKLNDGANGFTIEGNEYQATYSSGTYDEVIVKLAVLGYLTEADGGNEPGWYTFNGMTEVDLPATYSKAGTSSVSSVKSVSTTVNHGYSVAKKLQAR